MSLWRGTDHLIDDLAAFEDQKSRNAHNAVLLSDAALVIYIHLVNFRAARVFLSQLLDGRTDGFARTAPFRPKIDQNGNVRLEHVLFKIRSC